MNPLLSLCIPIYNRLPYLERQLKRMIEDKDLFKEKIQLIISDNCSSDDLLSCCEKYKSQGLNLHYHRNETNIGPDGNFDWCFHNAGGKYVWLLGSDDIPEKGILSQIV
ncbi:MAG: glycosyltransferase family 2 protein [Alphaproteobacteria bacterium]|nr:glycosyltransferase family 2 protein [Alphaproteobacteria bacterium]